MTTTLVTTTRDRSLCFSLLEKWVARQTASFDQWLIVNDGTERYSYTMGQEVIARDPSRDKMPSLCCNWLAAIPHIRGHNVVVLEDDDYYSPRYLETMLAGLALGDIAGITHDVYYRPRSAQFLRMNNTSHASLACTAFKSSLLPYLHGIIDFHRTVWIDQHLWYKPPCEPVMLLRQPFEGSYLHIGMKQMPGAAGLGCGHSDEYGGWESDESGAVLVELVGEEAASVYRELVE